MELPNILKFANNGGCVAQMVDYVRNPFYAAISRPFKSIARNEHGTATALRETRVLRLNAEKDVTQAQQELDRYRREQKALNVWAGRIQADLEAFSVKKLKLVSDILFQPMFSLCDPLLIIRIAGEGL